MNSYQQQIPNTDMGPMQMGNKIEWNDVMQKKSVINFTPIYELILATSPEVIIKTSIWTMEVNEEVED